MREVLQGVMLWRTQHWDVSAHNHPYTQLVSRCLLQIKLYRQLQKASSPMVSGTITVTWKSGRGKTGSETLGPGIP